MKWERVPADAADLDAVYALAREHIERYEDMAEIDAAAVLLWYRRKLAQHLDEYEKITVNGETAGFFRLHTENGGTELDDLYLYPGFQGRGIGTALLQEICCGTQGPMFLYVFSRNETALRLYRRFGFEPAGRISPTRLLMRRPSGTF